MQRPPGRAYRRMVLYSVEILNVPAASATAAGTMPATLSFNHDGEIVGISGDGFYNGGSPLALNMLRLDIKRQTENLITANAPACASAMLATGQDPFNFAGKGAYVDVGGRFPIKRNSTIQITAYNDSSTVIGRLTLTFWMSTNELSE